MLQESVTTRAAFDDFVRARWNRAVRVAYGFTLSAAAAEDLTQEAFARLWPRWRRLADEDPVGYLHQTIANLYLSSRRRPDLLSRLRQRPHQHHSDPADRVVQHDELLQALKQLSPQQRVVLVLRYMEDMSTEQVAGLLGCSVGTVKTHASRGALAMRKLLA